VSVWRKGAQREFAVTVAEMKEDTVATPARRNQPAPKDKARPNRIGLALTDLTDEQKKEMQLKSGVLIEDVASTVRGNVQTGDVILAIVRGGQSTDARTAAQVNELLAKLDKGASVTLQLRRGEQQFFSTLRILNGSE